MTSHDAVGAQEAQVGKCQRVLLIHRYYWPDTPPYAQILHRIACALSRAGFDVTVLTGNVHYQDSRLKHTGPPQELRDGVKIWRIGLLTSERSSRLRRVGNTVAFLAGLVRHVLTNRRYDLIMVGTVPPVAAGMVCSGIAHVMSAQFIYHCQDIHPEAALAGGVLKRGPFSRLLAYIDTLTCRRAAKIVVLSEDMRAALVSRGVDAGKIMVQNNFLAREPRAEGEAASPFPKLADEFRVLFAGNLGRFQGIEQLIEAARRLSHETRIKFVIAGDGALKDSMLHAAAEMVGSTVFFTGHLEAAVVDALVRDADLAVVSLKADVHKYAYPSKTMTYLAGGARLLIIADRDSELVGELTREGLAISCNPDSVEELVRVVLEAFGAESHDPEGRRRAKEYAQRKFSPEVVLPRWVEIFRHVCAAGKADRVVRRGTRDSSQ